MTTEAHKSIHVDTVYAHAPYRHACASTNHTYTCAHKGTYIHLDRGHFYTIKIFYLYFVMIALYNFFLKMFTVVAVLNSLSKLFHIFGRTAAGNWSTKEFFDLGNL